MEIKKMVNRETLTPEELDALDSGDKTEEDLISDWEAKEAEERNKIAEDAKKAKELAENYKIRAEKAEAKAKDTPKTESLPQSDLIALIRADVPEDDIQEVTDYAALKKISIAEALKSSVVRTLLSEKKEERKTAQVTATGNNRPSPSSPSGDELLKQARQGKAPDSDEDIERLVEAKIQSKRK